MGTSYLKNLKTEVEHCLREIPDTRNSDIKLTNAVWVTFYQGRLRQVDGHWTVRLVDIYDLPHEDNVKRIRAKIQNEKKLYLPTSETVRKQRKINEEDWRKSLGYNPELRTV
jgi:hypothetical protein